MKYRRLSTASCREETLISIARDLGTGALGLVIPVALLSSWLEASLPVPLLAMVCYLAMTGLILTNLPDHWSELGWANRVTLGRGAIIALLAGTLADPDLLARSSVPLAILALLARFLSGRLHRYFKKVQEQFSRLTEFSRTSINSIRMIKAYTLEAAYQVRAEDYSGSLEVGKRADFIVLDRNLLEIPADEIVDKFALHDKTGVELGVAPH